MVGFVDRLIWAALNLNPTFRKAFKKFEAELTDDSELRAAREKVVQYVRDYCKRTKSPEKCRKMRDKFTKIYGYDPITGERVKSEG